MSVEKVQYAISLTELFGSNIPNDESLRTKIGQRAIEMIKERTQEGFDKDGKPFQRYSAESAYSPSYVNSLAFKASGKDPSKIDMTQFGDMLGLLDIVKQDEDRIVLGWEDELQNAKADNHTNGRTVPKRDFFGLTEEQRRALAREFEDEVQQSTRSNERGLAPESKEDRSLLDLILELQDEF